MSPLTTNSIVVVIYHILPILISNVSLLPVPGQMDTELAEKGVCQAELCGQRLQHEMFTHAYASDLKRAFNVSTALRVFVVCFFCMFYQLLVLPHSPGVVYYHLLLRRETRIPRVAPFSFLIGIWDLFVHRGQKSYTPTAFGKLWTTPGVRCMKHASS